MHILINCIYSQKNKLKSIKSNMMRLVIIGSGALKERILCKMENWVVED